MPSKIKKPVADKGAKLHIRRGDKVVVLSGDNRGKTGTVIKMFPAQRRALVDGDAAIYDTKHIKANPQANIEGGRQQKLRPIHISKLALLDPTTNKPTRVKRERTADGVVRVAKKSNHRFETSAK